MPVHGNLEWCKLAMTLTSQVGRCGAVECLSVVAKVVRGKGTFDRNEMRLRLWEGSVHREGEGWTLFWLSRCPDVVLSSKSASKPRQAA